MSDSKKRPIRAALFVDFDNIYIGLKRNLDERVAESFATNPMNWIRWLEKGMPSQGSAEEELDERVVLVRRCYLNPKTHHRFRPYFIRSAFRVVDCPSLTGGGKNSADILMVMDILDTLKHDTHFDEFIILSGDADFTPVLLRLRNYDRRTVILTVGPTAEAYMAAADRVVTEDIFVEEALERGELELGKNWPQRTYKPTVSEDVLRRISLDIYEEASANGDLEATRLPRIFQNHPEFTRESNWLGFYSLRRLTERLVEENPQLTIEEGDPWLVAISDHGKTEGSDEEDLKSLRAIILERVSSLVSESESPVAMARAAHIVRNELGDQVLATQWAGAGTFRALLESARNVSFFIVTAPNTPGYLCDLHRHSEDISSAPPDPFEERYPELSALTRRIARITGVPRMTPDEYATVFHCISSELLESSYHLSSTSKAVRDLCIERGRSISRAYVTWVLRGIAYAEHPFGAGPEVNTAEALADSFLRNLMTLCNGAQLDLSPNDETLLARWITGFPEASELS